MHNKAQHIVDNYIKRLDFRLRNANALDAESANGISQLRALLVDLRDHQKHQVSPASRSDEESLETISTHIQLALETFRKIRGEHFNDQQNLDFLNLLSETYYVLGNYESALIHFEEAAEIALKIDNRGQRGRILTRQAAISAETGAWQKAIDVLSEAILLLQEGGNLAELALAQVEFAKLLHRSGDYHRACSVYEEALVASESVNDMRSRAVVLNGLGVIRRMQGHFDNALQHFQSAFVEFQKIQDEFGIADCLTNIGTVHLQRDQLEEAKNYFDKAHKLAQTNGYNQLLAFIYLNKSDYFLKVSDPHFAINAGIAALKSFVYMSNPMGISRANLVFARTFRQLGHHDLSLSFYAESVRIYRRFSISLGLANCYSELSVMFSAIGEKRRAKMYRRRYRLLMDDLSLESVIRVSAESAKVTEVK